VEELKLEHYRIIRKKLIAKSGFRIGGTEVGMEIEGAENPVIRDFYGMPYIPGSSLKGKLRSLLELNTGRFGRDGSGWITRQNNKVRDGSPCGCHKETCLICKVFGPHMTPQHGLGPSRIIVRNAYLSKESHDEVIKLGKEGRELSETKKETMVDRWTGTAADKSLRTQELIPAGTVFDLEISLRVFKGDNEEEIVQFVEKGLGLLVQDTTGGSGTRGYGWFNISDADK
jgi:CRISPR-associated protein Csm3